MTSDDPNMRAHTVVYTYHFTSPGGIRTMDSFAQNHPMTQTLDDTVVTFPGGVKASHIPLIRAWEIRERRSHDGSIGAEWYNSSSFVNAEQNVSIDAVGVSPVLMNLVTPWEPGHPDGSRTTPGAPPVYNSTTGMTEHGVLPLRPDASPALEFFH